MNEEFFARPAGIHKDVMLWRCGHCSEAAHGAMKIHPLPLDAELHLRMEKEQPLFERASGAIGGKAYSNQRQKCVCRFHEEVRKRELVMGKVL